MWRTGKYCWTSLLLMLFCYFIKMWRMPLFNRHNCGERKNTVGQSCSRLWSSGSQSGCREQVQGVTPIIDFTIFLLKFTAVGCLRLSIKGWLGCHRTFLLHKCSASNEMLKNTALEEWRINKVTHDFLLRFSCFWKQKSHLFEENEALKTLSF